MYNVFVVTTPCVAPYFCARPGFPIRGSTRSWSATAANGARFLKIENAHEHANGHFNKKEKARLGIGAMYQLNLETQYVPAVALASEFFQPTGPNALPASYSFRTIVTRSFAAGRLHLNGSIASYAVRAQPTLTITCPGKAAPGATCGGVTLPPLDGPCSIGTQSPISPMFYCAAPQSQLQSDAQAALPGQIETHSHWLLGAGIDKPFPLASTLLVADVFAEKFEGIGRKTDASAEIGARRQITPQVVLVGGLGRHFRGAGFSTFMTLGATISHAWQPFKRGT